MSDNRKPKLHALSGDLNEIMELNLGPQHPSTHGVLRLKLRLEGEVVISSEADHRLSAYRCGERV